MIKVNKLSRNARDILFSASVTLAVSVPVSYCIAIYLRGALETSALSGDVRALILFSTVFAICWLTGYPIAAYLTKKLGSKKKAVMIGLTIGAIPTMISFGIICGWSAWEIVFMTGVGSVIANLYTWIIFYYWAQMGNEE